MVLTSSPLNFFTTVVLPALSRPLKKRKTNIKGTADKEKVTALKYELHVPFFEPSLELKEDPFFTNSFPCGT